MAQSGYTPISLYYSTTASAAPTAGNLVAGELAINTLDGKLFYKDSSGVVQTLASKGTGTIGGSTTQVQYNSSGAFAGSANMTFDGTSLTLLGNLGVGSAPTATANLYVNKNITGGTSAFAINNGGTIQSDVTSAAYGFNTILSTAASAFTLSTLTHYRVGAVTIGSTSAITNQNGFRAESVMTGATNNYGFYGNLAAATGRYNLYMNGTADNYLAGNLGIGTTPLATTSLYISKNITGGTSGYVIAVSGVAQSDVTSVLYGYQTTLSTAASAFTLSNMFHFTAQQGTIGATSTLTNQQGFTSSSGLTGATNNFGFRGQIAAGTNRYNLYMDGTASNYMAGALGIGALANASALLDVQSTTQGVRMPNMTTTQKNAISSPAAGLMVFDTTLSKLCVYSGAAWQTITSV